MTDDGLRELLAKATPKPWRLIPDEEGCPAQCLTAGGFDIATLWGGYKAEDANSRLIALAPQLAAALIKAEEALVGMLAHSCVADAGEDMKDAEDHAAERTARAALSEIRALTGGGE